VRLQLQYIRFKSILKCYEKAPPPPCPPFERPGGNASLCPTPLTGVRGHECWCFSLGANSYVAFIVHRASFWFSCWRLDSDTWDSHWIKLVITDLNNMKVLLLKVCDSSLLFMCAGAFVLWLNQSAGVHMLSLALICHPLQILRNSLRPFADGFSLCIHRIC